MSGRSGLPSGRDDRGGRGGGRNRRNLQEGARWSNV
jgi:hypothetical protein